MPTPLGIVAGLPYPGHDSSDFQTVEDVPVFILSGRNLHEDEDRLNPFGNGRSRNPKLGIAYVKIGDGLSAAELRTETLTDRTKKKANVSFSHVKLTPSLDDFDPWRVKDDKVRHQDSTWVQALRKQLDESKRRHVVVFVHGYNTELIENTLLAAEIFHYLGRDGAMISFEWPSHARLLGYVADKGNAMYSTRQLRALLSNISKECDADSVTILAHSAGSPIVVNALREIRLLDYDMSPEEIRDKYRINRVVLAAPDMDTMAFINAVHDRFHEVAGKVAVYASPEDKALELSEWLTGSQRLGNSVGDLQEWESNVLSNISQIEMVDASVAEKMYATFLGHGYFHRDPWVSSDIGAFILGQEPLQRGLKKEEGQVFWKFPKDFPTRLERIATEYSKTRWAKEETAEEDEETHLK
ncbi:MAG: alpha/beta hydrolase [Pirellulaceae bacterium]|nr:alpha/beta hydrolase [Pirellulaceae bacterium]